MPKAQAVGSIMQGVSDIGTMVNDIISGIYQMQAASKSEKRAYKWAQTVRQDTLKQNAIQNQLNREQLDISKAGLGLQRLNSNRNWRYQLMQYGDQKKAAAKAEKRGVTQNAITNTLNTINQNEGLKNAVVSRMAA
jgi:hypothetical protein